MKTYYTATTIKDGTRYRGQVWRHTGSVAWEGAPRYHESAALKDAQKQVKIYSR